jgi:hypothetical protein
VLCGGLSETQIDAFTDITRQLLKGKNTPDLEAPPYTVVRRRKRYEIRKYSPFVVAETVRCHVLFC